MSKGLARTTNLQGNKKKGVRKKSGANPSRPKENQSATEDNGKRKDEEQGIKKISGDSTRAVGTKVMVF